jgi:hypothetical protein
MLFAEEAKDTDFRGRGGTLEDDIFRSGLGSFALAGEGETLSEVEDSEEASKVFCRINPGSEFLAAVVELSDDVLRKEGRNLGFSSLREGVISGPLREVGIIFENNGTGIDVPDEDLCIGRDREGLEEPDSELDSESTDVKNGELNTLEHSVFLLLLSMILGGEYGECGRDPEAFLGGIPKDVELFLGSNKSDSDFPSLDLEDSSGSVLT